MDDIAIKVDGVYKDFILPHEQKNSVKSLFTGFLRQGSSGYEKQHALKDISFEVKKGEFFGIVGRNGSGKSTLLKILARIYQPTKGEVFTQGKLVPFIELGVGFNPELSGRDNVYLNGGMLGFSPKEVDKMYDEIVEFAELERFMDQKLKNYSSGMQVRLAFSMAVRSEAEVLLIDEVLAVGDADFQRKCFDYFRMLKKDKKTVIFVSHDMGAIIEFCDRAVLIEKSEVMSIGETKKIAREYGELFLDDNVRENQDKVKMDKRTGSGAVRIKDIKLSKGALTNRDDYLELSVDVEGVSQNSELMVGFAVKNSQGIFINSTHTWEQQNSIGDLAKGGLISVSWKSPNIYEDGSYTIDVYTHGTGNEVYDRLEDAISFRVKRPNRSGSVVTVPVGVNIKKIK